MNSARDGGEHDPPDGVPAAPTEDPVARAFSGTRDLYDIAAWDERTFVDRFAVAVYRLLAKGVRPLVVVAAAVVLLIEFGLVVVGIVHSPALLVLTLMSVVPAIALAGYIW